MSPLQSNPFAARLTGATAVIVLGAFLAGTYGQTCLSSRQLASNYISPTSWLAFTSGSSSRSTVTANSDIVELPFSRTFVPCLIGSLATWLAGAVWLHWRRRLAWTEALVQWGWYGGIWWCLVDSWEWFWIGAGSLGWTSLTSLLSVTPQFWLAGCLAGWITSWLALNTANTATGSMQGGRQNCPGGREFDGVQTTVPVDFATGSMSQSPAREGLLSDEPSIPRRWLWLACAVYLVVFTGMNWGLYFNLLVPHGDSAMYEEHLWNLLHGKGFRSYLDQGFFLGEHIQFVHLFLLPIYAIWPSHLLLEACSSASLALGAFPIFWMVRRHTGSDRTAFAVAVAYLLYFPMQFLDIEIDLKTFRPESFGIPLLLVTLDQLDRGNLVGTLLGIGMCLTVKEDYTIVFGPLGLWIAVARTPSSVPTAARILQTPGQDRQGVFSQLFRNPFHNRRSQICFGLFLSTLSVVYLWLATRVVMPWFRSGVEVHYASYFARFGKSPEEIVHTMFGNPGLVFNSLATPETVLYAIALLAPLAFLPLFAPDRLFVGLPLFAILCLNELDGSRTPQHQFHAPLVAILFWSLAAALPRATMIATNATKRLINVSEKSATRPKAVIRNLVWSSALSTGLFFSLGPLGIPFWDPGSSWNWRQLYGPSHRAEMFAKIATLIPPTARVASTDFVHPRFTHYERSYDYSGYHRKVSGENQRIPDDTDFLVIDTQHRYSTIKQPAEIPEWRENPEQWELLPDTTEVFFIVLKRKVQGPP